MHVVGLTNLAAVLSLAVMGGCAGQQPADPEAAEYRRVDARLRAIDEYESFKQACRRQGGVVHMTGSWGRISPKPPELTELRCAAPLPNFRLPR